MIERILSEGQKSMQLTNEELQLLEAFREITKEDRVYIISIVAREARVAPIKANLRARGINPTLEHALQM